ncbi:MAG: hypothetical protein ACKO2P_06090 [Planctomycetota bacterium]
MAHRLDTYVIQGEISNLYKNSISGRIEVLRAQTVNGRVVLRPALLLLSITGNLSHHLFGQRFRFWSQQPPSSPAKPLPEFFHSEQIGVISDSALRIVQVSAEEPEHAELACHDPIAERTSCRQRASVYLEWHSQNGTVALELLDSLIEFDRTDSELLGSGTETETDAASAAPFPPAVSSFFSSDDTCFEIVADSVAGPGESAAESGVESDHEDHFQLFHPELEAQIRQSAIESTEEMPAPPAFSRRRWDEIIPGIDPETKRLYETWDEVLGGEKDEPLTLLFDEPLCLPTPASLHSESHAWQVLTQLLKAMALRGVAFDMCHHVSAKEAYRLLIEELLPEAGVHPGLVDTGFICHFGTGEFCPHCRAEDSTTP